MYPDAIFTIFNKSVTLYGICIAVGILACLIVFFIYTKKAKMLSPVQDYCFYIAVFSIFIGFIFFAQFFQAVYNWIGDGFKNFSFNAGITFMGGVIGGAGTFIVCYFLFGPLYFRNSAISYKQEFNTVVRVAPCCITIAHAFGRIGCMFAGCCYGKETTSPIGIYNHGAVRLPVQLFESFYLFCLFAVLTVLFLKRKNYTMQVYLIAYGVWRFILEFMREDHEANPFLGLRPSQWQSFAFIAGGIIMIIIYAIKKYPSTIPEVETTKKKDK